MPQNLLQKENTIKAISNPNTIGIAAHPKPNKLEIQKNSKTVGNPCTLNSSTSF